MRIFIGVAWPYANGPVHLGHIAGAILPADIFARYRRLKGDEVLMVSGSDEHGTPITVRADIEKKSPSEIVDIYHRLNSEIFKKLGITFSLYFRTSHEDHHKVVQNFFRKLYENGYIYEKVTLGTYCKNCKRFLPDRYVEGECPYCHNKYARGDQCDECGKTLDPTDLINPTCKICSSKAEFKETKHMFFRLSAFQKSLEEWVDKNTHWRKHVINFTKKFLEDGLKDRAITRDIEWGVKVPIESDEYKNKRIYVWFDAVIGYLSASIYYSKLIGDEKYWEKFWKDKNVKHFYFLGKDNIPFHTIIWPAMLMAYGDLNLPYDVPANQYLRFGGLQFSKSRGIGVWMPELLEKFDVDMIRFYAAINMPENHDSDFTWEDFYEKINKLLIDTFGNFIHRALTFTFRKYGKIPEVGQLSPEDRNAIEYVKKVYSNVIEFYETLQLRRAVKEIIDLAHFGNKFFDERAPWSSCKNDEECRSILYASLYIVKVLAVLLYPVIPSTSIKIWHYLGYDSEIKRIEEAIEELPQGQKLRAPEILFKKLREPEKDLSLALRVGRIISVEDHPNADRLYIIKVDFGEEKRQVIAGIKTQYSKEELIDKNVIIVTNLKKMKIRGEVSEGMLLAADDGKNISLLTIDEGVGEYVEVDSTVLNCKDTIDIDVFRSIELRVVERNSSKVVEIVSERIRGVLHVKGKPLKLMREVEVGARVK